MSRRWRKTDVVSSGGLFAFGLASLLAAAATYSFDLGSRFFLASLIYLFVMIYVMVVKPISGAVGLFSHVNGRLNPAGITLRRFGERVGVGSLAIGVPVAAPLLAREIGCVPWYIILFAIVLSIVLACVCTYATLGPVLDSAKECFAAGSLIVIVSLVMAAMVDSFIENLCGSYGQDYYRVLFYVFTVWIPLLGGVMMSRWREIDHWPEE